MTIRTKLLLFIPLLVLLVGSITLLLFRSTNVVQRSYDQMMERLLLYKQAAQTSNQLLQSLYSNRDDPTDVSAAQLLQLKIELNRLQAQLLGNGFSLSTASESIGYAQMLGTLLDQTQAALASTTPAEALALYEKAEDTAGFIYEQGSQLIDMELEADQPVFHRIQQENVQLLRLGAAVLIVETVLAALLALWISRSITRPIGMLVESAGRIARGELEAEPPQLARRDELGMMAEAFSGMLGGLREIARLEREQSEQQRLLGELELRSLQSQIRPHFLFNSLNALAKLALIEGAERTSDLIVSMSSLLRYNLQSLDRPVTLREELAHVDAYMTIQQARFRERITFERHIDERALNTMLPPLTLQPIVENAFVHGVEELERGAVISLSIEVIPDDQAVRITVADNGKGMAEQVRRRLLQATSDDIHNAAASSSPPPSNTKASQSAGLGMRNVFRRLELFFGERELIAIDSAPGQGTRLTITLPAVSKPH
ncbi:histidine kinase/DNA gyrase B/HSP90-like ATPase [Paenibacillus cellulosilyticus]|uniref:histidine kinase n=1 Tax=Paenibacillus cellulosilyticus TaxID=375489 RepID=A0A2V2YTL2_9BACL|nr:sensor histidine kinase [Paenibacillus cellulosilyticus]PWV98623.1 histidine kinase/DNA gyrase B/HSP90-like ATPase [Paenibacillus cellulosilyticus]QKS43859.1 sensor histidine kinase [Paenibacillus cellulosilyticus]